MTEKTLHDKLSVGSKWLRLIFMILFALVAYCIIPVIIVLIAVFQFIYTLFSDGPLDTLLAFSRSLSHYLQQIANYLTYTTEEKPFPFTGWPHPDYTMPVKPLKKTCS